MSSPVSADSIATNLAQVNAAIQDAAIEAGRDPAAVKLVAVSKNQPVAAIAAAVAAGQRRFGENTVQEALAKIPVFAGRGLEWHFIGHLQSNKAKHIPSHFQWLHSLDSLKLAERVARFAADAQATVDALIEVNVSRDPAKHGVDPDHLDPLIEQLLNAGLPTLRLRGLMAIGPHPASEAERRAAFAALRTLRDRCATRFALPRFTELSMGMSNDFREAILEGSTIIRIGTAIFGARNYPNRDTR